MNCGCATVVFRKNVEDEVFCIVKKVENHCYNHIYYLFSVCFLLFINRITSLCVLEK